MTPPATPLYARAPEPPAEENLLEGVPLDDKGLPSLDWINRQAKTNMVGKAIEGVEEYDEGALRDFYKQVVLSGAQPVVEELPMISGPEQPLSAEKRTALIEDLAKRLHPEGDHPTALLPSAPTDAPRHVVLTAALIQVAPKEDTPLNLPTGLVSRSQWQALLDAFVSFVGWNHN
jgi:hypothetical protein